MHHISTFLFCVLMTTTAIFCTDALAARTVDDGVSYALAQQRSKALTAIHYDLSFRIPPSKAEEIRGEEVLSFNRNNTEDVVIDFKASPSQLLKVEANGHPLTTNIINEHIIIPTKALKKGRNEVRLSFIAGNKSLNRNDDYLYTLFVPDRARTVFPCFDQPDLKSTFSLKLTLPSAWTAVSNGSITHEEKKGDMQTVSFRTTALLPTYLFSFVTGRFSKASSTRDGRTVNIFHRETDATKLSQLNTIFDEVFLSVHWMEQYTGIPYPFEKYDLIILPGFQFGGMEHAGAILYNDKRMFISQHPTPDEELNRIELIAHETSHNWFGDMVTMRWFNDVWTKEVFANYMASKISKEQFPQINHRLNFLKVYQIYALEEDRTQGTHPIQQPLDNLKNAGLLYGNIIYEKAPVMMRKLEQQMGSSAFRSGLQKYLHRYAYGNATWDNLIDILDRENPAAHVKDFSEVWVKQKGMPYITVTKSGRSLVVEQNDIYHRPICWRQSFKIGLVEPDSTHIVHVDMQTKKVTIPLSSEPLAIIPNEDGMGYGVFTVDTQNTNYQLTHWMHCPSDLSREAMLMNIYENFVGHHITADACTHSLLQGLTGERNALVASTCCNYLSTTIRHLKGEGRYAAEKDCWTMSKTHPILSCRQKLLRSLFSLATEPSVIDSLYTLWKEKSDNTLNEDDYMTLAYQLALRKPQEWKSIINTQRQRLTSIDRQREFDYISRGCIPDEDSQYQLFLSLLKKENRTIEPWTQRLLALLNSPLREQYAVRYIKPGLNILQEIQKTGDIFFPKGWLVALLSGHLSKEAKAAVTTFIQTHPNYPIALKNKLLQAAFEILNEP
jgi:aminopeptidase N